jgi:hypothetical protein
LLISLVQLRASGPFSGLSGLRRAGSLRLWLLVRFLSRSGLGRARIRTTTLTLAFLLVFGLLRGLNGPLVHIGGRLYVRNTRKRLQLYTKAVFDPAVEGFCELAELLGFKGVAIYLELVLVMFELGKEFSRGTVALDRGLDRRVGLLFPLTGRAYRIKYINLKVGLCRVLLVRIGV